MKKENIKHKESENIKSFLTPGRIKKIRQKAGITQQQLADTSETSRRTIQAIETGQVIPKINTLEEIAKALGYTIKVEKE